MTSLALEENLLGDLLERNNIKYEDFISETYNCMIVSIFEVLVEEMQDKKQGKECELSIKRRIRNTINPDLTVQHIVFEKTGCRISPKEANRIYKYLLAYFRKTRIRKTYEKCDRIKKLSEQNGKCNICGASINESDSELDHIIPWAMVGDELGINNLQMLCKNCNRHKSKSVTYNLKMFLINSNYS